MEFIATTQHGAAAVLTITRGKTNALNRQLIDELSVALDDAVNDGGVRGVVLASGAARFFSSGFDVLEVFEYDRPAMGEFFSRFVHLYQQISELPKPVVAAMHGASFAGGSLLGLACDFRVMAAEHCSFALNEVNLGFVLTPLFVRALIDEVGLGPAREILLGGESVPSDKAYQIGLANEVAKNDVVVERAMAWAETLGEKPPRAFGAIKEMIAEVTGVDRTDQDEAIEVFLDHWFSAEAEGHKQALLASLKR